MFQSNVWEQLEKLILDDSNGESGIYIVADQHTPVDSYTDFRHQPTRRKVKLPTRYASTYRKEERPQRHY